MMIKIQIMIQMLFHGEKEVQVDFLLLIIMSIFIFNFFRKPIYTKNNKNFKRIIIEFLKKKIKKLLIFQIFNI